MMRAILPGAVGLALGALVVWGTQRPPPLAPDCPVPEPTWTPSRALPAPRRSEPAPVPPPVAIVAAPWDDDVPALGEPPLAWPDDDSRAAMSRDLRAVAEACGLSEHVVAVDCAEPPCLLGLLLPAAEEGEPRSPDLSGCPAWGELFPDGGHYAHASVLCPDGVARRIVSLGPHYPERSNDPHVVSAQMQRQDGRMEALKDAAGCTAPTELRVENRLGHRLQWVPE